MSITSGTLRLIVESCTLVPNAYAPKDKPSFRVAVPTPDALFVDLLTIRLLFCFNLIFDVILDFLTVAISLELGSELLNPLSWSCVEPTVKINLSEVNASVEPSDLINEYLSSSKARKTSLVGSLTCIT